MRLNFRWWMLLVPNLVAIPGCEQGELTAISPFHHDPTPKVSQSRAVADRGKSVEARSPASSAAPGYAEATADPVWDRLIGMEQEQIATLFGAPNEERDRSPGKSWLYHNGQCALEITLYPAVESRIYHALAYEVTSDDSTDKGRRLCLAELQSRVRQR